VQIFVGLAESLGEQLKPAIFEFTEAELQTCSTDTRNRLLGLAVGSAGQSCRGSTPSEKKQVVEALSAEPSTAVTPAVAVAVSRQKSGELSLTQLLDRVSLVSVRSHRSRSRRRASRLARTRSVFRDRSSTPRRGGTLGRYRSLEVLSPELKLRIGVANPMDIDEIR